MYVTSFLYPTRYTIFVNLSTKTIMTVNPFDSSKSVTRSVVTCAHCLQGISRGRNNPAFALVSDSII